MSREKIDRTVTLVDADRFLIVRLSVDGKLIKETTIDQARRDREGVGMELLATIGGMFNMRIRRGKKGVSE